MRKDRVELISKMQQVIDYKPRTQIFASMLANVVEDYTEDICIMEIRVINKLEELYKEREVLHSYVNGDKHYIDETNGLTLKERLDRNLYAIKVLEEI